MSKLINKVERLEVEDGKHLKEIQIMQEKLKEVMAESLNEKAKYREALENKDVLVVVAIVCSLVSVVILIVLAYTCLETRNELLHLRGLAPRL